MEILFCFAGLALLGFASGETWARWNYQSQQEWVLEREPAPASASVPAVDTIAFAPAPLPVPVTTKPVEKKRRDLTALGRIEIPRLGIAAIVEEGADQKTLARAVGRVPGTAHPGELGNMVLAGHRDTFFRPLRNIKVNDRIRMVVPPHTYEYEVQSLRVVAPEETSVLRSTGVEQLTLVTCYPFRYIGPAPERFIVSAARVN